jgi:hypothetical protein
MFHLATVFLAIDEKQPPPRDRARAFGALITAATVAWTFLALESRARLDWASTLLPTGAQAGASEIVLGSVVIWIGIYTVFIVTVYLAGVAAIRIQAGAQDAGFGEADDSAPQKTIARFATLFLPLVAGSLDKILEGLLSTLQAH